MKKEMVIIVPGVRYFKSDINLFERIILRFYNHFNENPISNGYVNNWVDSLSSNDRKVLPLKWARNIDLLSKWRAVYRLKKLIKKHHKNYRINLIGISLGGEIILEAVKNSAYPIDKIILLCSINEHKKTDSPFRIFNLYSPFDMVQKAAISALSPSAGGIKIEGKKVKNILVPNFKHEDFCSGGVIKSGKYRGKSLLKVVDSLLQQN